MYEYSHIKSITITIEVYFQRILDLFLLFLGLISHLVYSGVGGESFTSTHWRTWQSTLPSALCV